jgi:hypothetical protein
MPRKPKSGYSFVSGCWSKHGQDSLKCQYVAFGWIKLVGEYNIPAPQERLRQFECLNNTARIAGAGQDFNRHRSYESNGKESIDPPIRQSLVNNEKT